MPIHCFLELWQFPFRITLYGLYIWNKFHPHFLPKRQISWNVRAAVHKHILYRNQSLFNRNSDQNTTVTKKKGVSKNLKHFSNHLYGKLQRDPKQELAIKPTAEALVVLLDRAKPINNPVGNWIVMEYAIQLMKDYTPINLFLRCYEMYCCNQAFSHNQIQKIPIQYGHGSPCSRSDFYT